MQDEVDVTILNAKNSFTSYMCAWLHHILIFFFTNTSVYVSYTMCYVQSIGPVTFIISCWFLQASLFLLLLLFQSMGAGWQVQSNSICGSIYACMCKIESQLGFNSRKSLFIFVYFANKFVVPVQLKEKFVYVHLFCK